MPPLPPDSISAMSALADSFDATVPLSDNLTPDTYTPYDSLLFDWDEDEVDQPQEVIDSWDADDRTRLAPNFDETVKVLVGPTEEPFTIHKDRLCMRSKFFAAALNADKRWLEGQQNLVRLPEVHPRHFRVWVDYLYTGCINLTVRYRYDDLDDQDCQTGFMEQYVLAEYLDDETSCQTCLRALIELWQDNKAIPSPYLTGPFYERTAPGSPLRKYLVEVTRLMPMEDVAEFLKYFPRDFLEEWAKVNYEAAGKTSRETFGQRMTDLLLKGKEGGEDKNEKTADTEAGAQNES